MHIILWNIINYICFCLLWYGLIVHTYAFVLPSLLYCILFIMAHQQPMKVLITMILVSLCGLVLDTTLIHSNVLVFSSPGLLPEIWFFMLWPLFATCLCSTLRAMQSLGALLQIPIGFVASAIAYSIGQKLTNAIEIKSIWTIATSWAILFPLFCQIARKYDTHVKDLKIR